MLRHFIWLPRLETEFFMLTMKMQLFCWFKKIERTRSRGPKFIMVSFLESKKKIFLLLTDIERVTNAQVSDGHYVAAQVQHFSDFFAR